MRLALALAKRPRYANGHGTRLTYGHGTRTRPRMTNHWLNSIPRLTQGNRILILYKMYLTNS
ncbi:hypothetical protein [Moorena sp. SIO3I8]|uniref:hypothetical protein n=1 Tax=Moorena sp. SIO3I8 TaxID=2607833 RepID=UPI0013C1049A|nr:hypothetical protein [Moorena sp. SIO3I8]NEO10393.1 hypothetical protein [Moorena sp. SIO3I8]